MARARVLIVGSVQGVGYRALVKFLARRAMVKGLIRNLDDGRVEIFFDGEAKSIERVLEKISVKSPSDDPLSINVSSLAVFWEGGVGYEPPWKPYRGFEIDYGDADFTEYERISLESTDQAKLQFTNLRKDITDFRIENKTGLSNLKESIDSGLRADVTELRSETKAGFSNLQGSIDSNVRLLDEKYGGISRELVSTREELKTSLVGMKESFEGLRISVESLPERTADALIRGLRELR